MNNSDVELSVVMPAYNEGDKIYNNSIHVSAAVAKFCDSYEIVVVNDGKIEAVGTHQSLLKDCQLYQDMWRAHIGAKEGEKDD